MIGWRVIPCLLLRAGGLYKTVRFSSPRYVGDPINILRIFNDKEVDEVVVLDIEATREGKPVPFEIIADVASECFMPLCYGGGIRTIEDARKLFSIGLEKVALNTAALETPELIREIADEFGSQSVVVSIDVARSRNGAPVLMSRGGTKKVKVHLAEHVERSEAYGAGEIFLTAIDREGTGSGYDLELIKTVAAQTSLPVVAHGGARGMDDFAAAFQAGASAVASGSSFVFQGKHSAVLISYPSQESQDRAFNRQSETQV